ncbi:AsmA family protein [Chitinilyticum piscinae]|uniref:AsmA family protein n=1 Tax=Chitinilyticum piscinae TaxID=2866724 RepID=A0A8J7FID8_9NEIS|nr:AsmA family protein [Chitinilyticum piscinae]MBE9609865.1 AsmA family protein [Chitinilyticum piscinae]
MKIINKSLIALIILAALLAAAPLLLPLNFFAPQIERHVSRFVHGKATIGHVGFRYAPMPELILGQLVIDNRETAMIETLAIPLSPAMLLDESISLRELRIETANLSSDFARLLPQRLHGEGSALTVDGITFSNTTVYLDKSSIGPLNGKVQFYKDGRLSEIQLSADEGRSQMRIAPAEQGQFLVEFTTRAWTLPLRHPVTFDSLRLAGKTDAQGVNIDAIQASLYGGNLTGNARLSWEGNWTVSGQLQARQLNAKPLLSLFSPVTHASGKLDGEAAFRATANQALALMDTPSAQGVFRISEGQLHNLDLVSPLKAQQDMTLQHGGQTAFNTLTGNFAYSSHVMTLSALGLDSGKFRARGNASIKGEQLSGQVSAQLISGPVALSGQIGLGGTLSTPSLRTGGSARPGVSEKPEQSPGEEAPQ